MVVYTHILDCRNHPFIRQVNLSTALNDMTGYLLRQNQTKDSIEINEKSKQKDRVSVLDKIRKNNLKLSKKNILALDSIRMLIKNAPTINDNLINCMYGKLEDN